MPEEQKKKIRKKKLSKRELQIFELLIREYKGHEIAELLQISEKTVSTYKLRILEKTETKTIIGMYFYNQQHNLVDITQPVALERIQPSPKK